MDIKAFATYLEADSEPEGLDEECQNQSGYKLVESLHERYGVTKKRKRKRKGTLLGAIIHSIIKPCDGYAKHACRSSQRSSGCSISPRTSRAKAIPSGCDLRLEDYSI